MSSLQLLQIDNVIHVAEPPAMILSSHHASDSCFSRTFLELCAMCCCAVSTIICCNGYRFRSSSYLDRGSLSSWATGFRKPCSFRESLKDLRFSDGVIPLQMALHFGTFGSFISCCELRFLRWNRRFRDLKSEIERHRLLNTGPRFAKDFDILPDILSVTYRHDSGENSARWYPYTWRLTLCHCHRLVKRWSFYTTLSLRFSGGCFRRIFEIYAFLSFQHIHTYTP